MPTSPELRLLPDELIAQGRAALLEGDRERARALLQQAVALDPRSDEAWVWLAGAHTSPEDMAHCLRRALAANPLNEQAQEGLQWLADEYGITTHELRAVSRAPTPDAPESSSAARAAMEPTHCGAAEQAPLAMPSAAATSAQAVPAQSARERSLTPIGIVGLLEAALLPMAAGALLGLLRLASWLWPATLVLLRPDAGSISWSGAVGIALAAVVTHGLALVPAWIALGWGVSRARGERRGDLFDSLLRAAALWAPALLWSGALLATFIGLRLGPLGWRLMNMTAAMLVATGLILMIRRLWLLLLRLQVPAGERRRVGARLMLIAVAAAMPGLLLAGWIMRGLFGGW